MSAAPFGPDVLALAPLQLGLELGLCGMKSSVRVVAAPSDISVPGLTMLVRPLGQLRRRPGTGRPRRARPAAAVLPGMPHGQ